MKSIIRVKNIEKIREWVNWSINFCFQNDCLQNDCSINNLKEWFFISLWVSTVETNRDWDFLICRDQLLKLVEIILTVETRLFFFLVKIFKIETFQSRLSCVEIFEICHDFSRFIETSQHYQDFLRYFRLKNWP